MLNALLCLNLGIDTSCGGGYESGQHDRWMMWSIEGHTCSGGRVCWALESFSGRAHGLTRCYGTSTTSSLGLSTGRRTRAAVKSRGALGFRFSLVKSRPLGGSSVIIRHGEGQKLD